MSEIYSRDQILARVDDMAAKIQTAGYENPIFLALLNGAVPFGPDLMQAMVARDPDCSPTLRYMFASTYKSGTRAGTPKLSGDNLGDIALPDRHIIVLDDVLDTGATYRAVKDELVRRGVGREMVKLAVLAQKVVGRPADIVADHIGFELPNWWLYGTGLNGVPGNANPEAGRWDPGIYAADN